MDPWIEDVRTNLMKCPRDVEHWQLIIDMHHWLDKMAALRARCSSIHLHAAAEMETLDRWFRFARDSASVEDMRWLERRIKLTIAWAESMLDPNPGRCEPHNELLSLTICGVCLDASGVGCGNGCGARGTCERCRKQPPNSPWSTQELGSTHPSDNDRRGCGPICWGCGARGVPLMAPCGHEWGDDGSRCPRAVCTTCHLRQVPCNACAPYFPSAPRPTVFTR